MLSTLAASRAARLFGSAPADRGVPRRRAGTARARRRLHPRERVRGHGGRRGAAQRTSARGSLARSRRSTRTGLRTARGRTRDGIDLNRNFPAGWRPLGPPWSTYASGARPWSEPEARLVRSLVARLHPRSTVWFHQHLDLVWAYGRSSAAGRRYARVAGMRFYHHPWLGGGATNWQNRLPDGERSFTVELPAGSLTAPCSRTSGACCAGARRDGLNVARCLRVALAAAELELAAWALPGAVHPRHRGRAPPAELLLVHPREPRQVAGQEALSSRARWPTAARSPSSAATPGARSGTSSSPACRRRLVRRSSSRAVARRGRLASPLPLARASRVGRDAREPARPCDQGGLRVGVHHHGADRVPRDVGVEHDLRRDRSARDGARRA